MLVTESKGREFESLQDKKINVLHVVSKLPIGGVENMLLKVVDGYDKKRFNVSVCCIKEGGKIANELRRLNYQVEILNKMRGHGFDFGAVKSLYNLMKRKNIHILRTHQYHSNLYGRIAGILARVPVIIPSFHNLYKSPNKPKFHRRAFNYILSFFSDILIAVSNSVASDMVRFDRISRQKIKVIYNGIEIKGYNTMPSREEARVSLGLPLDRTVIGTVGRLTDQKGHRYLINAVSRLSGICLAIAGDGPLLKELKELAEQNKVNCIFMGQIHPERVSFFLRALDIFCFPSLWEGFATALAEAMVAGLPIIASDISPLREVMLDAGMVIPPHDSDQLAQTLKMLIDNPSLRETLGDKAKKRTRVFSIENTIKAYENLFEQISREKKIL